MLMCDNTDLARHMSHPSDRSEMEGSAFPQGTLVVAALAAILAAGLVLIIAGLR